MGNSEQDSGLNETEHPTDGAGKENANQSKPGTSNKFPKVAVITPWFPSKTHPTEGLFVLKEVQALRENGIDARVIYLDREHTGHPDARVFDRVPVIHLPVNVRSPWSMAKNAPLLRRVVTFSDVIHSHAISALPVAAVAKGNKPWVHTEHWSALTAPETAEGWLKSIVPLVALNEVLPDVAVGESARLVDALQKYRPGKTVKMIPCVVPLPPALVERRNISNITSGATDNSKTLHLASTGGLIDRKDPLLAVRTLKVLQGLGVKADLRWIGIGPLDQEVAALAKDLDVSVTLLGAQPPEVVQSEIADCDIFFAPTKGENFFVAAAEALVNGRPLCAGSNGGHREYAPPAFSELVAEQTPEAYAQAIVRLDEKTKAVTAEEISETVAPLFSPATVAAAYRKVYQQLLDAQAANRRPKLQAPAEPPSTPEPPAQ